MKLAPGLDLPAELVTKAVGVMGIRGSGKTYAATKLFELLHDAGAQQIALDPTGVWWGLRLSATGKKAGLDVAVLGGLHGDIPLEPTGGRLVAETLVRTGSSAILDLSQMTKGQERRFATDFAETLLLEKKRARTRTALMLHLEEAQIFVPQRCAGGDAARMLGAFESVVKLGRNFGIGVTLISQRPQAVNKDALNQVEVLITLQINGAHERKAIRQWVVDNSSGDTDLSDRLPGLQTGEAVFWSPSWLGELRQIKIAKKRTFDASATPTLSDSGPTFEPKPLDLGGLQEAMAEVVERQAHEDPKALRVTVAALEDRVAALQAELEEARTTQVEKVVEVPVIEDADVAKLLDQLDKIRSALQARGQRLTAEPSNGHRTLGSQAGRTGPPARTPHSPRVPVPGGAMHPEQGPNRLLTALARMSPRGLTRTQLALLAGYSARSGTFSNYLSKLRAPGLIEDRGGEITLSDEGRLLIPEDMAPLCGSEVRDHWLSTLGKGPQALLDRLIDVWPNAMTRDELAENTGYSARSGTYSNYLSKLRSLGLVDRGRDIKATDDLFVEAPSR